MEVAESAVVHLATLESELNQERSFEKRAFSAAYIWDASKLCFVWIAFNTINYRQKRLKYDKVVMLV
jgi:hypothetical protein